MFSITSSQPYTKVIVVKIDDIESTIIDEHNFGLSDTTRIEEFKENYSEPDTVCLTVVVE
jgi:hypothetical protein